MDDEVLHLCCIYLWVIDCCNCTRFRDGYCSVQDARARLIWKAFTVTSHGVSRGCPAAVVGRRFVRDGLCVYFAGIRSLLFALILLTYKIMIMLCIGAGYIGHGVDGAFYFLIIQEMEKRTLVESVQL